MPTRKGHEKIEVRWEEGIFVGVHDRSGEVRIATKDGIIKAWDIKSMSGDERWQKDKIVNIVGTPWKPNEKPEIEISIVLGEVIPYNQEYQDPTVKRAHISREDIRRAGGYLEGCQGCKALVSGARPQGHSDVCRARVESMWKQ